MALDQSRYRLSRPCFPVAAELRIQENRPSQAAAASPSLSIPTGLWEGDEIRTGAQAAPRRAHREGPAGSSGKVFCPWFVASQGPAPGGTCRAQAARQAEAKEPWREKPGGKL